jgi:transposase IS116/IS110/IS902 family protein
MTTTALKALVQGAYDIQKLRIGMGNRIAQAYYQAHGVDPGEKPEDALAEDDSKIVARIKKEYRSIATGIVRLRDKQNFAPSKYLPEYVVVQLCRQHEALEADERLAFRDVEVALAGMPVWDKYLKSVTGCGPAMAGVLLSTLDVRKAERPSQFWSYAGLDVAPDGRGRSRRKEHLVRREYVDRDGAVSERLGITFNPFLKTKLRVLATSFMRSGNPYYRAIYDGYKNRLEHRPDWKDKTPGHRHNAALRYMTKLFLVDLWREWRTLESLPVVGSYAEEKLGLDHRHAAE